MEDESEEEFELQPVNHKKKVHETKKSKKLNEVGGKKKKKRKSEGDELEVTAKKSKKTGKNSRKDSKKTAKETKKVGKKRLTSKSKDKFEISKTTEDTILDESGNDAWTNNSTVDTSHKSEKKISHTQQNGTALSTDIRVDPKKIFRIEDHGHEVEGESLQQKRIDIQQAFANDDVMEEFVKEKSEIEDAAKPKDVDLSLPGWGSWAGVGIKPSEKKKKALTKKADPAPPRKDRNLSHVIINEEKSKLFSKNQVGNEKKEHKTLVRCKPVVLGTHFETQSDHWA